MLELEKVERERLLNPFRRALNMIKRIKKCEKEVGNFLVGLGGGFIEPGASGSVTRGKIEVLPTGRNFYAIDPTTIPTPSAWKIGAETADKLVKYYLEKHGRYPESVGQVLWSIDGYKADGEQLAQILWLFGTRPIWDPTGFVRGIEVISLEELGRPRIDSVVRMSGIMRDTLPNYIYLIDEAVSKVVVLDEPLDRNYVRKHYMEHLAKLVELGKKAGEAERSARCRVYCSPPGTYGTGVNLAVEASAWRSDEDLAKTWIQWGGYAYTKDVFGKQDLEGFALNVKRVDVVTRQHVSDEHDIFNCCCYYGYHGGFYNTVKKLSGRKDIEVVVVDTKDVSFTHVREMKEEIERVARVKLLNPVWISEMKKHGYRGANEFSKKILHLYGWSSTTRLVEKWIFDSVAETYVLDEEMRRWLEENNVWALEEIARRLIEAAERGLWKPSEEVLERLKGIYGEVEGLLEESVTGEIQGGTINVYTAEEVDNWQIKASEVRRIWEELRER